VLLHLTLLHLDESSNEDDEVVEFYYYYFIKDLFAFFILLISLIILVFFKPNLLSHPDNYTMASISVTPAHLVPEWYFLPFYAVLRATPDKFGGLLMIFLVLLDFFLIDIVLDDRQNDFSFADHSGVNGVTEHTDSDIEEDEDVGTLLVLFFLGGSDIDEPFTDLASVLTLLQFLDYFDLDLEEDDYGN